MDSAIVREWDAVDGCIGFTVHRRPAKVCDSRLRKPSHPIDCRPTGDT